MDLTTTTRFISTIEANGPYAHFLADEGDIVIASSGITIDRLDEKVAFVCREDLPFCMNTSTIRFKAKEASLDAKYLFRFLTSDDFKRQIGNQATGSAQLNFGPSHVKNVLIPMPAIAEQRAISSMLGDADALLSELDRIIAKKRDLKQAAMQQLLTGEIRLPGFAGRWEERRLGDLGKITGAGVDKKVRANEVPVRLLNYMDVYRNDAIRSENIEQVVTARSDQATKCTIEVGDVFFTPTSEVRDDIAHSAVAVESIPGAVYSYHLVRLRLNVNWDIRFRSHVFKTKSFLDQVSTLCEGSGTRYVITLPKFRSMVVRAPIDVAEQRSIAAILSDIDAEIDALEQRRAKTVVLKQGMMQELLTGRTRLV